MTTEPSLLDVDLDVDDDVDLDLIVHGTALQCRAC